MMRTTWHTINHVDKRLCLDRHMNKWDMMGKVRKVTVQRATSELVILTQLLIWSHNNLFAFFESVMVVTMTELPVSECLCHS